MKNKNENTGPENTRPENETPAAAAAWLLAIAAQNVETVDILPADAVRPSDETAKRIAAKLPAGRIGPVYCFDSEADAKTVAVEAARFADQRRRFVPSWGLLYGRFYFACLASADAVPVTLETATVAELAEEMKNRRNGKLNNNGRIVKTVAGESGRTYLEVWDTNETGRPVDLVVSCCVESGETEREAVEGLLNEFKHPFGAAWESPEQYGKEFDAVLWLAEFYGIETEQNGKGESK